MINAYTIFYEIKADRENMPQIVADYSTADLYNYVKADKCNQHNTTHS